MGQLSLSAGTGNSLQERKQLGICTVSWPGQVWCADSEAELTPTGASLIHLLKRFCSYIPPGPTRFITPGWETARQSWNHLGGKNLSDQVQTLTQHCQKSLSSDPASPRNRNKKIRTTNPNDTSKNIRFPLTIKRDQLFPKQFSST